MKKYLVAVTTAFFLISPVKIFAQQNIPFAYFMNGNTYFNPASAGAENKIKAYTSSRYQWIGFENPPGIQFFSLVVPGKFSRTGYGLNILSDRMSSAIITSVTLQYAYKIKFRNGLLSAGLEAGWSQLKSDLKNQHIKDTEDPQLVGYNQTYNNFETSTGLYFYSPATEIGLSARHLQNLSVTKGKPDVQPHYYFTGSHKFFTGSEVYIQPALLVRYITGLPLAANVNALVKKDALGWIGGSVSSNGNLGLLSGLNLRGIIRSVRPDIIVGYAFETPVLAGANLRPSSHEIFLNIQFEVSEKVSSIQRKRNKKSLMLF